MIIACLPACASLCAALLFTTLASPAGAQNQTWIRYFGTPSSGDGVNAAAPDGLGGVYVSGSTSGSLGGPSSGNTDAWLAHYDGTGNQIWIRQLGSQSHDHAMAAAPDETGGVFVSGSTLGSFGGPSAGSSDAWTAHYDSAGNRTWIRQFGTAAYDYVSASASDGAGGVYLGGYSSGSLGGANAGGHDAWLARYDGTGNQTWIRQLGTTNYDGLGSLACDGAGGVYATGYTGWNLGGPSSGGDDVWLALYDGAGTLTWIRQFGTPDGEDANAAAPDGLGGVYVSGATRGSLGGTNSGGLDAWLAHYDGTGTQTWIRQFGTPASDTVAAAAPDGMGGVYISGSTLGSLGGPSTGGFGAWLAHYGGGGNQAWIRQLGASQHIETHASAYDGTSGVFVGGRVTPTVNPSDAWLAHYDDLGATRYCTPAVLNSTGQPGMLTVIGMSAIGANDVTLGANHLPQQSFGFFVTSMTQGVTVNPGGSQGNLCLSGNIGRFVGQGQIMNSGTVGSFSLGVDLFAMPSPTGFVVVAPGQTWNFQAWYRDANPGPTSNFTDAVSVTFL